MDKILVLMSSTGCPLLTIQLLADPASSAHDNMLMLLRV